MKILIANRGEIARRVMRTATRCGHETVAVFADPDAGAPFVADADEAVRIGPADLASSYLSTDAILAAAAATNAAAVHPGYGFLSENAAFARAVIDAGLIWIGPSPELIDQMGSKIEARRLAADAGVPIIPGFDDSQDPADLAAAAERIGFPVLIKAAAGGGGKGIRIVRSTDEFAPALAEATAEGARSFGDAAVIVERYIERPRHVEVQVLGDKRGNVIHLGTRECSVQRRYQKVLEEAPAPNLPDATRERLQSSAVELAASLGYDSAGTVEYVVDDATGEPYFLEMNTRLQVEHPVTEYITGLDLVELQIRVATGESLPLAQDDVAFTGHAFEARINAEDATNGFVPQTGTVTHLRVPRKVRWDAGIEEGSTISPHYDAMVAKLIVGAPDRTRALAGLRRALDEIVVGGLVTNTGFHRWLVDQAPVVEGRVTTRFLDETEIPPGPDVADAAAIAAVAWDAHKRSEATPNPWTSLGSYRTTPHENTRALPLRLVDRAVDADASATIEVAPTARSAAEVAAASARPTEIRGSVVAANVAGATYTFEVVRRTEHWAPDADAGHGSAGAITAPFPAVVAEVPVSPGDAVGGGDVVVVIEAMKMLHSLKAAGPGVVGEVRVAPGDNVETNQILITFEENDQ